MDVEINDDGEQTSVTVAQKEEVPIVRLDDDSKPEQQGPIQLVDPANSPPRKYYIDNQPVEIVGTVVFDLDAEGRRLRSVQLTEYAGSKVKTIWRDADELKDAWTDLDRRAVLIAELEKRGIELSDLGKAANQPDADPFDLLCHLAFQSPLHTRKDRAARLKPNPSRSSSSRTRIRPPSESDAGALELDQGLEAPSLQGSGATAPTP